MEYLYVIYLFSGFIKVFLNFLEVSLNIDFTLLSGLLLIACYFFCGLMKNRVYRLYSEFVISMYLLMLFYIWMNISIVYSLSSVYSNEKSILFLTNILAFMIPIFYSQFDLAKFLRVFAISSTVLGMFFVRIFSKTAILSTESANAFSGLYLGLPEICGVCILCLILFDELFSNKIKWILVILNSLVVILGGGRGPIIFVAATLMPYILVTTLSTRGDQDGRNFVLIKKTAIIMILICASLFLVYTYIADTEFLFDRSVSRLMKLYDAIQTGTEDTSFMARLYHFAFSINLVFDGIDRLLFGYGLGSYGILYTGLDGRGYPHNIVLEILVETGFIGCIIFCGFIVSICRGHLRANPLTWVILYLFLNTMKSGSLVDLRLFFGFLGLILVCSKSITVSQLVD